MNEETNNAVQLDGYDPFAALFREQRAPEVSAEEYGRAVASLASHALNHPDTSGARVCAQVVLGIWSSHWHLDIVDLCLLDDVLEEAAWTAMKGRVQLHREPQHFIANGVQVFDQLRREFDHLNVGRRYAEYYEGRA